MLIFRVDSADSEFLTASAGASQDPVVTPPKCTEISILERLLNRTGLGDILYNILFAQAMKE